MDYQEIVESTNRVMAQYRVRLTVRQIYYRLVSPPFQLFQNDLNSYKRFDSIITRARERGEIDWTRIEDRARAILGGEGQLLFESMADYAEWDFASLNGSYYNRSRWNDQDTHVEVWVEKDALASLFESVANGFKVIVFPSRGYSSYTKVMDSGPLIQFLRSAGINLAPEANRRCRLETSSKKNGIT